ncbi:MAG: hypothetical protein J0G94_01965 [Sphingomonadales bacterium]|nr:hypothetical protein [Sphingomonadales bacterium]
MEADKLIATIEKYVREFILYVLSFFWIGTADSESDPVIDVVNKTFVFAILSATAGAYLWNRYIYGNYGGVHDLPGLLTDTLLRWLSYGIMLYGLMRACRINLHILFPILAVFKVFSVAHIIAIFGSYMVKNSLWMFSPTDEYLRYSAANAAKVAYVLQAALMFIYMPREILGIVPGAAGRVVKIVIIPVFLLIAGYIALANYLDPLAGIQSARTIGGEGQPSGKDGGR